MFLRNVSGLALLGVLLIDGTARADRRDVLLVVNRQVPDGQAVADAYRAARDIPADSILAIDLPPSETVSRADYLARIENPLAAWLDARAAHDEITYIVLTRGVPLRVSADPSTRTPLVSVDSQLTLLYRKMTGTAVGPGPIPNPLFTERPTETGTWPAFDRKRHDVFLVSRLDGFTQADAVALATRCAPPPTPLRVVLDARPPGQTPEHQWLPMAAERLRRREPAPLTDLDQTREAVRDGAPVIGYVAWGAADPALRSRTPLVPLAPGAIGSSFSSSDARTFKEPPGGWMPGAPLQRDRFHEGSAEWLAGDWVRAGITGWAGAVADPYVDGVPRPQVFLPAYLGGRNLGEAFALATRYVGWRGVVLGDPLCRPFGAEPVATEHTRDEASGLTMPMFERRVEQARRQGRAFDAAALGVAVQARIAQGQRARGLDLLRAWIAGHPDDVAARQLLGLTLDPVSERTEAIAAYRAALALRPEDPVMANNLAYALAGDPAGRAEALTLARRAYERTRGEPAIADTYGWVLYQSGELDEAARVLQEAARRAPRLVEAHLHLALVHLKQGQLDRARQSWLEAGKLDAAVATRPEAAALRETFGAPVAPAVKP